MKTTLTVEGVTVTIESAERAHIDLGACVLTLTAQTWARLRAFAEDQELLLDFKIRSADGAHVVVEPRTLWAFKLLQLVERGFVDHTTRKPA
jgi:hypothetical protein